MLCWIAGCCLAWQALPNPRTWTVEGVERQALLVLPARGEGPAPVVFVFHGHGGGMRQAARSFRIHEEWPEALVVYMQGLPTPGMTDPQGVQAGWQRRMGDQGDRDLAFFDRVLAALREEHAIDESRIYATGHSNGGAFTYLLWAARPNVFAAYAPSAAPAGWSLLRLRPAPVLHIAGENDELVPFVWQRRTIDEIRGRNGCAHRGEAWGEGITHYPSKMGTPVVTFLHAGGHRFPREAPALIVRFFKEHARVPAAEPTSRP